MIDPKAISQVKVYPPIGIARVGNAPGADDYVIGPEVIGGTAMLRRSPAGTAEEPARYVDDFRTPVGEIKRQAARFRIYAQMKNGSLREVTASDARITWRVSVANLKAGWYEFKTAMDLPLAENAPRRNRILGQTMDRNRFDITPTSRLIEGVSAGPIRFNDGTFINNPVVLGELRTDPEGRLIFLGGHGVSAPFGKRLRPLTFANNEGWHDDVCDGPVRASVTFPTGQVFEAVPGYVVATPPNYAPGLVGVVTIDDAVREVFQDKGWIGHPTTSSFTADIWPIFDRLTGLQWVNHGFFLAHGFGSPLDARDLDVIAKLKDSSAELKAWRTQVFGLFRDPAAPHEDIAKIPQAYGDGLDWSGRQDSPGNTFLAVTRTQYAHLRRWASGEFVDDWSGAPPVAPAFETLSPEDQVTHLERAPLHECVGGPFHPAIELTWVMRLPLVWQSAYRLNVLPTDDAAAQEFGEELTPAICCGPNGPFDGVAAGALTRFLGVPWQTDHTSCNSAADYAPSSFLSMPTFWGARAPDQVLPHGHYLRARALAELPAVDSRSGSVAGSADLQTLKHVMQRRDWLRDVRGTDYYDRLEKMIAEWADLGMILPTRDGVPALPGVDLCVEQGRNDKGPSRPRHLIDDRRDAGYLLLAAIERLHAPVTATMAAGAGPPPASPEPPPKRTYRQGQI